MSSCGAHIYDGIDQTKMDGIIAALSDNGAVVSGNNPWDVDTKKSGVKLNGSWDKAASRLSVTVTDKDWYVPCGTIWSTIDDLIHHIQSVPTNVIAAALKR